MPGAGKQPSEVQAHIKELLEAGFDPTTIHRKLKVGRSSIYRMKRCLQQHGTAYMPTELNKKNGRPKVLTAEQELEVRDWLRDPKNRNRYLDDLVWLIHDRFNIVCSTTTMSKLKRKWMHVIEAEESGETLDESTRAQVMETHPDLPILQQIGAPQAPMMQPPAQMQPSQPELEQSELPLPRPRPQPQRMRDQPQQQQPLPQPLTQPLPHAQSYEPQIDARLLQTHHQVDTRLHSPTYPIPPTDPKMHTPYYAVSPYPPIQQHAHSQMDYQLQQELASHAVRRM